LKLLLLLFYFEMLMIWKKVNCKQQQQQPWARFALGQIRPGPITD
jgi:hypothetical protein